HKTYDVSKIVKVDALNGIDLSIEEGTITTIYGVSGSGKSTMLNIIGCLDKPTSGKVTIKGSDTAPMNDKTLSAFRNENIGFVFQEFNLIPHRTAYDNLMVPLYFTKKDAKRKEKNIDAVLEKLGILKLKNRKVSDMSGGQRQRVAIGRALINECPIIIADEPTGQVDSAQKDSIAKIFKALRDEGKTILIATHDESLADIADKVIHIADGKIVE
ncbi:MAG: ABC transporter ATP-binding protein, partial [Saccharofermentans sp.]|nr:ABC transporter ATP-binding protein [Saccharofermentans sp.]